MKGKILPKLLVSGEDAKEKIEAQIEKGEKFRGKKIDSTKELEQVIRNCQRWSKSNEDILLKLFGESAIEKEYKVFSYYTDINLDTSTPSRTKEQFTQFLINLDAYRVWVGCHIDCLRTILAQLERYSKPSNALSRTFSDEVFIVHGRDDGAKETVARFLEKLGLRATILHEQPSGAQTIIEKLEKYAGNAGFAVVLLTPDDIGALKNKIENERKPRARQNVVFELGYFMGKLGRERVCPLFKGEIEKPSDIDGVLYVPMDEHGAWRQKLVQEMASVGIDVDMNKLLPNIS